MVVYASTIVRDALCRILSYENPEESAAAMARELEALRREKRRRLLLDEARAMLRERDISPGFAGLLLGEDSADTRRRVELFERQLSQTLQQCLAARLPAGEPRDFAAAKPQKRPRGIRRP